MNDINFDKFVIPEDKMPKGQTPGQRPMYPENKPSKTKNPSGGKRSNKK